MKARLNISLTLAAACLCGLSSCVSIVSGDGTGDTAISFATPSADTKAAVEDNLSDNSEFLVWGGYRDDANSVDATNVFNGETVTGSGNVWNYTGGTRYWVAGKTYDFYAVYPADIFSGQSSTSTDTPSVTCSPEGIVTIENFDASATGEAAVDLMLASASRTTSDPISEGETVPVPFSFSHLLTSIEFVGKIDEASAGIEGFSARLVSAKLYGMAKKGDFSVDKNNILSIIGGDKSAVSDAWILDLVTTEDSPFASVSFENDGLMTTEGKSVFGEILFFPCLVQQGFIIEISYSVNGVVKGPERIDLTSIPLQEWQAGMRYRYTFSVSDTDRILFDVPTVRPWDDATGGIVIVE